jgi:hypothetical protein
MTIKILGGRHITGFCSLEIIVKTQGWLLHRVALPVLEMRQPLPVKSCILGSVSRHYRIRSIAMRQ